MDEFIHGSIRESPHGIISSMTNDRIELYKKYRPKTWDDVIGQDGVVKSLKDDVIAHRKYTGYLFSGPRGCGKTTLAWILAKAVNCPNLLPDGSPCNECEVCKSIDNQTSLGVRYVSAANLAGVAGVRELTSLAYRKSTIRRQVFIVDEIQSYKQEAFDAFLIPLESDNMDSLFIFCTTDIKRVPKTFTSRVQQRNIRLVDKPDLIRECNKVLGLEGYTKVDNDTLVKIHDEDKDLPFGKKRKYYSDDVVTKAMKSAGVTIEGGSVRQVLSALDGVLSSQDVVLHDWPALIAGDLYRHTKNSDRGDAVKAIKDVARAIADGSSAESLTNELLGFTRDLMLAGHGVGGNVGRAKIAQQIGDQKLAKCFDILSEAIFRSTMDANARVYLEDAIIRISAAVTGKSL